MKKIALAIMLCLAALSCAEAAGLVRLNVTGTNVNIRDGIGLSGTVVGKADKTDVFIAQDWPSTSSDGSQWYRLIFSVGKDGKLQDVRQLTKTSDFPYIVAQFVQASPLAPGDDGKIQKAQGLMAPGGAPAEDVEITVANAKEFLAALGSDRTIIMAAGGFHLSGWDPEVEYPSQSITDDLGYLDENKMIKLREGITWEGSFDGGELNLTGVRNLTIIGDEDGGTAITVDPRYAFVMKFVNSSNIVLKNLTAGHTEGGYCEGGVYGFDNCSDITISGNAMYGCGTMGLELNHVRGMTVEDSVIYECTYHIMDIRNSQDIIFNKSVFRDNMEFTMVNLDKVEGVSFHFCHFIDNTGQMFNVSNSKKVVVADTKFSSNTDDNIPSSRGVTFQDCLFE